MSIHHNPTNDQRPRTFYVATYELERGEVLGDNLVFEAQWYSTPADRRPKLVYYGNDFIPPTPDRGNVFCAPDFATAQAMWDALAEPSVHDLTFMHDPDLVEVIMDTVYVEDFFGSYNHEKYGHISPFQYWAIYRFSTKSVEFFGYWQHVPNMLVPSGVIPTDIEAREWADAHGGYEPTIEATSEVETSNGKE